MRIKIKFVLSLALKQTLEGTRKWPLFCGMRERVVVLFFYIYIVLKFKTWEKKNAETLSDLRSVQTDATTA